jgi:hypothetical protein
MATRYPCVRAPTNVRDAENSIDALVLVTPNLRVASEFGCAKRSCSVVSGQSQSPEERLLAAFFAAGR